MKVPSWIRTAAYVTTNFGNVVMEKEPREPFKRDTTSLASINWKNRVGVLVSRSLALPSAPHREREVLFDDSPTPTPKIVIEKHRRRS